MSSSTGRGRLLTILGLTFGLAITIGNTIGAGILRTPGTIAEQLPSVALFLAVWVGGALYALLGANALAELATLVPRSGGQYVFVRRGLGEYPGFVVGWSDWLSTSGTTAAVAIVVGEYATALAPGLGSATGVALALVVALTLVQWRGLRWGALAQDLTSLMKTLVLLALIAACFALGGAGEAAPAAPLRSLPSLFGVIVALQAVIYTYDGWTAVIYFSEEVREPGRNVPRSMFGGVLLVTALYLLINVSFLHVVPLAEIAGEPLAAAVVAERLFGAHGETILRLLVIVALVSAVNSNVLMAPRVLYAMACDGLFWRRAVGVNRGGTPDVAVFVSSLVAAAFLVSGTFEAVIAKLAFFFVANYTLSFTALFVLRRREPGAARPYRAWGHPVTTGLALVASLAFLAGAVAGDPESSLVSLGLLLLSLPLYLLLRRMRRAAARV